MTDRENTIQPPKANPTIRFLGVLTVCYMVGFVGTEGSLRGLGDWYLTLAHPSWTPPPWLYAPISTLLYGLMGCAVFLVWHSRDVPCGRKRLAISLFAVQLVLTGAWSWVFFAFRLLPLAAVVIGVLWLTLALTVWSFRRVNHLGALLLSPCLLWSTYALAFSIDFWILNR